MQANTEAPQTSPEAIVKQYERFVYWCCHRQLGRQCDAEDAAQEVFIVLWRNAEFLATEVVYPLAWIKDVARRQCRYIAWTGRRSEPLEFEGSVPSEMPGPIDNLLATEMREEDTDAGRQRLLADYLTASFTVAQRQLFDDLYVDELTPAEIAERRGLKIGSVRGNIDWLKYNLWKRHCTKPTESADEVHCVA